MSEGLEIEGMGIEDLVSRMEAALEHLAALETKVGEARTALGHAERAIREHLRALREKDGPDACWVVGDKVFWLDPGGVIHRRVIANPAPKGGAR